jgi:Holliday junction resolvase RusA-like endonuclease
MKTYTVELPYPPTANNFKVPFVVKGKVRFALSKEAAQFKEDAGKCIMAAHLTKIAGPVKVRLDVYRPRRVGDLDNAIKLCLDSLTGQAFEDDKQIVEIHARRHEDKANPRVVVTLTEEEL